MTIKPGPLLIASLLLAADASAQVDTRYVDQSVNHPSPNGIGWSTAYDNLQPAIDDLLATGAGGRILVAEGTYEPDTPYDPTTSGGNHSQKTFLIDGSLLAGAGNLLGIHGGFLGYQNGNPGTTDFDNPDGSYDNTTLRATASVPGFAGGYHVLTVAGMNGELELDGFTVARGYANGPYDASMDDPDPPRDTVGGGMRILRRGSQSSTSEGQILIDNCSFERNYASTDGGAIWIENGSLFAGTTTVRKTNFIKNSALEGGAIWQDFDTLLDLSNAKFKRNGKLIKRARKGGAILVQHAASIRAQNCVFHDNEAIEGGGAVHLTARCVESEQDFWAFQNCTFAFNKSTSGAGGLQSDCKGPFVPPNQSARFRVDNSVFWENSTTSGLYADVAVIGGLYQIYSDYSSFSSTTSLSVPGVAPAALGVRLFGNPIFVDPAARNLRLKYVAFSGGGATSSPCIDTGSDHVDFMGLDRTDLDGDGDVNEALPLDMDLETRVVDIPLIPGAGNVDMGAFETAAPVGGGL